MEGVSVIRVLVVDDQPLARAGIALTVSAEHDITVVGEAADGQEALEAASAQRPDVILMDVRMPGADGVSATRMMVDQGLTAQNGQPIGIIMLTTYHLDEAVCAALRAGASGFLLKDAHPTEIMSAIRSVAAGKAWLDPTVAHRLIDEFTARPEQDPAPPAEMAHLTPREREVLSLMARGLSNSDAAKHLVISKATTKKHLSRVMAKLRVREKSQAVTVAYQSGLVQPPG